MPNMKKMTVNLFQMLTCICCLRKVWEVEFLILLRDIVKPTIYIKTLKSDDSKQESKHIIYLDANNLCGCAMSKFLSTSEFKWIDPKDVDLNKITKNSSKGRAIEFDLQYAKELTELHNDALLAPDVV